MRQDVLEINGYKIFLPIGLEETMDTPVRDSYQTFLKNSTNDVRRHLTCLTTLLPPEIKHLKEPKILHAFGGLGASAQVIDQTILYANHTFWERDPTCLAYLMERYTDVTRTPDSMEKLKYPLFLRDYDVILLDMSVGTIKTRGVKDMWKAVATVVGDAPQTVVWFTDTACHKIHLNYKTYAKDFDVEVQPTSESYLRAYDTWLRLNHNLTIVSAMREAGEFYCVVKNAFDNHSFQEIPYV